MSRKLLQTVASMTAKRMRVAVAMLAALALGVGGAAAAVGSLNAASVANETVQAQTLTEDDPGLEPAADPAAEDTDSDDDADPAAAATAADEEDDTATESDRNQTDCVLPEEFLPTATDGDADGTEVTDDEAADDEAADDEAADDEAEVKIWRNHGEFVSWVAHNKALAAGAVQWAAQSDCGKKVVSASAEEAENEAENEAEVEVEDESLTTERSAKADHDQRWNAKKLDKKSHSKAHASTDAR